MTGLFFALFFIQNTGSFLHQFYDGEVLGTDGFTLSAADTVCCFSASFLKTVIVESRSHISGEFTERIDTGEDIRDKDMHGTAVAAISA